METASKVANGSKVEHFPKAKLENGSTKSDVATTDDVVKVATTKISRQNLDILFSSIENFSFSNSSFLFITSYR